MGIGDGNVDDGFAGVDVESGQGGWGLVEACGGQVGLDGGLRWAAGGESGEGGERQR